MRKKRPTVGLAGEFIDLIVYSFNDLIEELEIYDSLTKSDYEELCKFFYHLEERIAYIKLKFRTLPIEKN